MTIKTSMFLIYSSVLIKNKTILQVKAWIKILTATKTQIA